MQSLLLWPRYGVAGLIRLYQLTLSFWLGRRCRFLPSCSAYAHEAILRFGVWRGGGLALKRVAKCHPWGASGFDPVPDVWQEAGHCPSCKLAKKDRA